MMIGAGCSGFAKRRVSLQHLCIGKLVAYHTFPRNFLDDDDDEDGNGNGIMGVSVS